MHATHLVNHVALGMPAFVSHIPVDLDELLEDGRRAPDAFGGEAGRIVEMTVHVSAVFIVRVLGSKERRTDGTGKMLDVELLVCGEGSHEGNGDWRGRTNCRR